jgi:hypothetical protein
MSRKIIALRNVDTGRDFEPTAILVKDMKILNLLPIYAEEKAAPAEAAVEEAPVFEVEEGIVPEKPKRTTKK